MQITISAGDLPHQTAMMSIHSLGTKLFPNWLIVLFIPFDEGLILRLSLFAFLSICWGNSLVTEIFVFNFQ